MVQELRHCVTAGNVLLCVCLCVCFHLELAGMESTCSKWARVAGFELHVVQCCLGCVFGAEFPADRWKVCYCSMCIVRSHGHCAESRFHFLIFHLLGKRLFPNPYNISFICIIPWAGCCTHTGWSSLASDLMHIRAVLSPRVFCWQQGNTKTRAQILLTSGLKLPSLFTLKNSSLQTKIFFDVSYILLCEQLTYSEVSEAESALN